LSKSKPVRGATAGTFNIAIIGAGLAGIAAAVYLKKAGIDDFTIFEQSAGAGGTWRDNTYPGCECDIPIVIYSYSFAPHAFPRTHASQKEILAYIEGVIDEFALRSHIRFNTRVEAVHWDDQRHQWTLDAANGERHTFNAVVSALGMLSVPQYPSWPGLERFKGPRFHTARWEHQHDLTDKRVAVVGIGSSAAQVVPAIAADAGKVMMFAREPAYVMPKGQRPLTQAERASYASPLGRRLVRARMLLEIERNMSARNPKSARQRAAQEIYRSYREEVFADRPDLAKITTPDYPFACKRPVNSSDLLPSLTRENVQLVPHSVVAVTENGVVDDTGVEHPADVLVMATGFQPWNFLRTLKVVGQYGRALQGVWGGQPEAFLGVQVSGFPNFFIMYGPNTNYMCVTWMLEQHAKYISRAIKRLLRTRRTAVDVRRGLMDFYNRRVGIALSRQTLDGECNNYYHSASGRNVVTWPWRGSIYWLLSRFGWLACTQRNLLEQRTRTRQRPERAAAATPLRSAREAHESLSTTPTTAAETVGS
jgi:cation diffusion facilitator CzcD-associated flavoprotein CzcO